MPARKTSAARKALERPVLRRTTPPMGGAVLLDPPPWLTGPARAWFEHFASIMGALKTSRLADAAIVAELAHTAGECERIRDEIAGLPGLTYETTTTTGGTMVRPYPQIAMLADATKRLKGLLEACGLTPASATRADANHG